MTKALLSLGSNIEPEKNILEAATLLSRHVKIVKSSTVYLTEPLDGKNQPKYYNCVIEIETDIEPQKLKRTVLEPIEEAMQRTRTRDKYADRTMDIDLVLYGNYHASTKYLTLPDPEVETRPFLAIPIFELEPELVMPGINKPIKEIAEEFRNHNMIPLRTYTVNLRRRIRKLGV